MAAAVHRLFLDAVRERLEVCNAVECLLEASVADMFQVDRPHEQAYEQACRDTGQGQQTYGQDAWQLEELLADSAYPMYLTLGRVSVGDM